MAQRSKEELKVYYKSGSRPTAGHYVDLIDSFFNRVDEAELHSEPYRKTLFVDKDSTVDGEKGFVTKPFASIDVAAAAATAGDLIIIFPSNTPYEVSAFFQPGITYFALPGVVITQAAVSPIPPLFTDAVTGTGICKVLGYATLIDSGSSLVEFTQIGSELEITCDKIELNNTTFAVTTTGTGSDCKFTLKANEITQTTVWPVVMAVQNMEARVKVDKVITVSGITFANNELTSKVYVENTTVITSAGSFFGSVQNSSYGKFRLTNCVLLSSTNNPTQYSLNGTFEIFGTVVTNMNIMPTGTSVLIGNLIVDTTLTV